MTTTLIISTYNRPDALRLVLDSVLHQSVLPNEIIIGDDGSDEKTQKLIEEYQNKFTIPLIHVWQEDKGFRVASIRNMAIKKASYDYMITIDGDIIMHNEFIASHLHFAKKGVFLQGHRVMLNKKMTNFALANNKINFSFFEENITNRKNTIHNYFLANIFSHTSTKIVGLKGCVFSFWKDDAYKVNGLDERFIGWGKEDSEFALRLMNIGIKRKDLRFCAVSYHLDHGNSNKFLESQNYKRNVRILNKTKEEKLTYCKDGLNKTSYK